MCFCLNSYMLFPTKQIICTYKGILKCIICTLRAYTQGKYERIAYLIYRKYATFKKMNSLNDALFWKCQNDILEREVCYRLIRNLSSWLETVYQTSTDNYVHDTLLILFHYRFNSKYHLMHRLRDYAADPHAQPNL